MKSPSSRAFFGLALAALIPIAVIFAAEPFSAPKRFRAHIGGFGGGDFVVELHGNVLTYTARSRERGKPARAETVAPTAAQWRDFRTALDELRIWDWKGQYPSQGAVDGTQWSIEIAYPDQSLAAQGSNNFPDAAGQPHGQPVPTKTFQRYLAAVKNLLGGREFE